MARKKLLQILLFLVPGIIVFIILAVLFAHGGRTGGTVKHYVSEEEANREIIFDGGRIFTTKASYVKVSGNKVTIIRSGTYTLKGRLDEGQIIVDVGDEDEVKLKLDDCIVTCSFGSPIYVRNAKKLKLRLKEGSENELIHLESSEDQTVKSTEAQEAKSTEDQEARSTEDQDAKAAGDQDAKSTEAQKADDSGQEAEDTQKGCIYARSDLTIKGDGLLKVVGYHRHGIFSSKDLRIKGGTIEVAATRQALHGKKSVLIENGDLTLKAGTDGIHSNGSLDIVGGTVQIDAGKYGMYAYTKLYVDKSRAQVQVDHALSEAGCQGELEY